MIEVVPLVVIKSYLVWSSNFDFGTKLRLGKFRLQTIFFFSLQRNLKWQESYGMVELWTELGNNSLLRCSSP